MPEDNEPFHPPSELTDLVIREVLINFRLKQTGVLATLLRVVMHLPAREFGKILYRIDQGAIAQGIHGGALNVLHHFVTRLEIRGWATPMEDPLLVVANHPGGTDPFVLTSAIARPDLYILSQNHIVFDVLPNLKSYLVCMTEDRSDGHIAIRKLLSLLKNQKCVLLYPGGDLELDPALFPNSGNLLRDWSRSIALLLSRAPEALIQPVILRGTISSQLWKNRLVRIGRSVTTQLQIAMIAQIAFQQLKHDAFPVQTTLIKGKPLHARELDANLDPDSMHKALMAVVNEMIRSDPLQYPLLEEIVPAGR
jgi:1-acyl-sn-glycerol-3-phosphate acyltransferase